MAKRFQTPHTTKSAPDFFSIFRRKKSHTTNKRKVVRTILLVLLVTVLVGGVALVGLFAYVAKDLPDPSNLNRRQVNESTKIYDRNGELLYEVHGEERRTVISIDNIPPYVGQATVAIEDDQFYHHMGFRPLSIMRALLADITGGSRSQGGSTITQQFVKNTLLTKEKSFIRKAKELILAIEVELKFSKKEILEMYLNQIPYGANAYGVQAAAQTYFSKDAKDLTIAEAAALAALPQAPSYYSPYGSHQDILEGRRLTVLKKMYEQGYINQEQYTVAKETKLVYKRNVGQIKAPHFVFYIREQLADTYGEKALSEDGLQVYTTLDMKVQKMAEDAIAASKDRNAERNASNAAMVAIDPKTGQILAMVGSRDFFDESHDGNVNVALSERQPGSSFKPYAYLRLFEKGYTPDTILYDVPTNFGPDGSGRDYVPNNYSHNFSGPLRIREALDHSLNIPAVKALYLAGIDDTIDLAHKLGITTLQDRDRYGLSLVLGGGEVRLLDHVAAYSVFANDGVRNPATGIMQVKDHSGKILQEYTKQSTRVVDEQPVRELSNVLSDKKARAFFATALDIGAQPAAAKTGTTQNFRDGWTMGYTPYIAAGVWAGNNNNTPMRAGADGLYVAAPIWQNFMKAYHQGLAVTDFQKPNDYKTGKDILDGKPQGENKVTVCTPPGLLATSYCPEALRVEKIFKQYHDILYYVKKDDPRGDAPKDPKDDPQFDRWESAVQAWAATQPKTSGSAPTKDDHTHDPDQQPTITITSPADSAAITESTLKLKTSISAPQKIKMTLIFIDDVQVAKGNDKQRDFTLNLSTLAPGFHRIRATVTDKVLNETSTEVLINYTPTTLE